MDEREVTDNLTFDNKNVKRFFSKFKWTFVANWKKSLEVFLRECVYRILSSDRHDITVTALTYKV